MHYSVRDVVGAGVAEDVAHRGRFGDVAASLADNDGELRLPVELFGVWRREEHIRVRPHDGRRVLCEDRGKRGYLLWRQRRTGLSSRLLSFLEMLAVVPADAEHIPRRTRDRSVKLRAPKRNAPSRFPRGAAKLTQELVAGKQQVEHVVFVGRTTEEVYGRDDRVVRRNDTRRRHATLLERADPHATPCPRPAGVGVSRGRRGTGACDKLVGAPPGAPPPPRRRWK